MEILVTINAVILIILGLVSLIVNMKNRNKDAVIWIIISIIWISITLMNNSMFKETTENYIVLVEESLTLIDDQQDTIVKYEDMVSTYESIIREIESQKPNKFLAAGYISIVSEKVEKRLDKAGKVL